jgi:site-specific DNA-methyltransferase (cytosine-N4-specific)
MAVPFDDHGRPVGTARIVHGNARDLPIEDGTVDLIVTSPPYLSLRSYQDGGEHYDGQIGDEKSPAEYVDALLDATREMVRVLAPSGSIWVNLGDKYARTGGGGRGSSDGTTGRGPRPSSVAVGAPEKSLIGLPWRYAIRCIDDLGLILRAEVVWQKPSALPESVKDRVRRSHETWFHFTKEPRYFSNVDAIREPHVQPDRVRADVFGGRSATLGVRHAGPTVYTGPPSDGRVPGSVWSIAAEPLVIPPELGVDHFAAFPVEWPRRLILGWSEPGMTVLDPFGGTGTTALVAKALGRHGVSVDLSTDYCRVARWRVDDPVQIAKALRVDKPPVQVEGQVSLFDGDAA